MTTQVTPCFIFFTSLNYLTIPQFNAQLAVRVYNKPPFYLILFKSEKNGSIKSEEMVQYTLTDSRTIALGISDAMISKCINMSKTTQLGETTQQNFST
jgi:hypothetical protein